MAVRTIIGLSVVLGCFVRFADGPAQAQSDQERAQLIVSSLPSRQSSAYKSLKALAGNPSVQLLSLTKSEVWSVPKEKVDAVTKAAGQHGIGVRLLGERSLADGRKPRRTRGAIPEASREPTDDWNEIFRLAPADIRMNDKQKQIMEIAKASRATTAVGVVEASLPAVVEYALTKGEDASAPSRDSARIVVTLGQGTMLTINRTRVEVSPRMCVWHGTVEGTEAPATIMWWPDGKMAGALQHQGRLYSIRHLGGQMHAVVEMSDEKMPQEHAPMPAGLRKNDASLRDDPLVRQGDGSTLRPSKDAPPDRRSQTRANKDPRVALAASKAKGAKAEPDGKAGARPGDIVIDVIVAYTKKAAGNYADMRRDLVDLSIEEANQSFRQSGLGHVKLRLVHAYQTTYTEEGAAHFDHVWRLADKGDGYLEEIHPLREKHRADVAMLIVDDPQGCGLATRVYADADEAFAVIHHECAATSHTLAHEIGHLIGARHDLNLDKSMTPFPYGHGYVNGTKWRDIMSYKESCNGCPRLPVWSSPKVMVRGEPAGTPDLDNARVIAEQAARVAAFR